MKKLSPRAKFIAEADIKKLAAFVWDAMQLASTHDPDHEKRLRALERPVKGTIKARTPFVVSRASAEPPCLTKTPRSLCLSL